jgi:DNA mismatch endonuclease (patch repair protein)
VNEGRRPFKRIERRLAGESVLTTTEEISSRMTRVRQRGTDPELVVRAVASRIGLRYRLRNRDLPGNPDLANRRRRFAIFVHGCFWHRHHGCLQATTPKSNVEYWVAKFERNVERDRAAIRKLEQIGYKVVVVWGCETTSPSRVAAILRGLIGDVAKVR